jgi:hypothetical protein
MMTSLSKGKPVKSIKRRKDGKEERRERYICVTKPDQTSHL